MQPWKIEEAKNVNVEKLKNFGFNTYMIFLISAQVILLFESIIGLVTLWATKT